jgi:hypothetical protein
MNDQKAVDAVSDVVEDAARRADLPERHVTGWDGDRWKWLWADEQHGSIGELTVFYRPDSGESDRGAVSPEGEMGVSATVWKPRGRKRSTWTRSYWSRRVQGDERAWWPDMYDRFSPNLGLSRAMRKGWTDIQQRLREPEADHLASSDIVRRFRERIRRRGSG